MRRFSAFYFDAHIRSIIVIVVFAVVVVVAIIVFFKFFLPYMKT